MVLRHRRYPPYKTTSLIALLFEKNNAPMGLQEIIKLVDDPKGLMAIEVLESISVSENLFFLSVKVILLRDRLYFIFSAY